MRILVVGLNYAPEPVGTALYTSGLAEGLAQRGHAVHAIVARPHYPQWQSWGGFWPARALERGVDVTRLPLYVPARPTAVRRLLCQLSFLAFALLPVLARAFVVRPHVVMAIVPGLAIAPLVLFVAWLCGARSLLHVQDFEVDAAIATGFIRRSSTIGRLALFAEGGLMRAFHVVTSISPQMCRLLVHKGVSADRVAEVRNWADTDVVLPLAAPSIFRSEWNIETAHVALYAGSIGSKQGMGLLVDVARLLQHRTDLTFIVCGEGSGRPAMESQAAGLGNMRFYGLQPRARLGELLGLASVHLLPQIGAAADYLLPSKLGNMLASARPVLAAAVPGTGLADAVRACGLAVSPDDPVAFAAALERLLDDATLYARCAGSALLRAQGLTRDGAIDALLAALQSTAPVVERA